MTEKYCGQNPGPGLLHEKLRSCPEMELGFVIFGYRRICFAPFWKFHIAQMKNSSYNSEYGILRCNRNPKQRWPFWWTKLVSNKTLGYLLIRTNAYNIHCSPCCYIFWRIIHSIKLNAVRLIEIVKQWGISQFISLGPETQVFEYRSEVVVNVVRQKR